MIQILLKFIFFILVIQMVRGVAGLFMRARRPRRPFANKKSEDRVKNHEYKDLTPYDIEDAEFEDIPSDKE